MMIYELWIETMLNIYLRIPWALHFVIENNSGVPFKKLYQQTISSRSNLNPLYFFSEHQRRKMMLSI